MKKYLTNIQAILTKFFIKFPNVEKGNINISDILEYPVSHIPFKKIKLVNYMLTRHKIY